MLCEGQKMALASQIGSSYCVHTEIIRSKPRNDVVFSMTKIVEASKMKEFCAGFLPSSCNSGKKEQILRIDGPGVGNKRGRRVIVTASPPTEDAVIATEPLTKEDLVQYLASGCKPKEKWRYSYLFYYIF